MLLSQLLLSLLLAVVVAAPVAVASVAVGVGFVWEVVATVMTLFFCPAIAL